MTTHEDHDDEPAEEREVTIDRSFYTDIKGRPFIEFGGLLDGAHQRGITALVCDLVQAPSAENGQMAIVRATVTFRNGAGFSCLGDASPASTSPQIAPHAIRMAETRAIGRCFRMALNVAATMREELGADGPAGRPEGRFAEPARAERAEPARGRSFPAGETDRGTGAPRCMVPGCDRELTANEQTQNRHYLPDGDKVYCGPHLAEWRRRQAGNKAGTRLN